MKGTIKEYEFEFNLNKELKLIIKDMEIDILINQLNFNKDIIIEEDEY